MRRAAAAGWDAAGGAVMPADDLRPLPAPQTRGAASLEEALARRRSVRDLAPGALTAAQLGQLLWAAQGITDPEGRRAAPSAGALYPLELYAVTAEGIFRYLPADHALALLRAGDARPALRAAAWEKATVGAAPLVLVVAGVVARTAVKYGPQRALRYVQLEAGHAAQNVLLEAVSLGLGAVPVGAFEDDRVRSVMALPSGQAPLYLLLVGRPA